jgi:hypothetical protein
MKKNSASTMLAVLAMLTTLSACVIASLNYTATVSRNVVASNSYRRCMEVGDGTMEYMFAYWRELCKEQPNALRPTADFANIPLPTQSRFPAITNFTASTGANPTTGAPYTVANYKVQAVDPQMNILDSGATPVSSYGPSRDNNVSYYLASADISLPAFASRMLTVKMRRIFTREIKSPWQYAIFYNDLLEINPGAAQTITGWVHTNNSLYTAMSDLTFQSKVDYGDDWGNPMFAPGDHDHDGQTPQSPSWPSNLPPARGQIQLPFGLDPTQIFTGSSANNTGYHELIEPPVSGQADPIASTRYYDQAAMHIMVDSSNAVSMTDSGGNAISSSTANMGNNPQPSYATRALYLTFNNAVTTNQTIQDNREAATMRLVTVDLSAIASALTPPSSGGTGYLLGYNLGTWGSGGSQVVSDSTHTVGTVAAWNGILYAADTSGTSAVKRGVRLKNGATIKGPGLTVASENPIYIQGDFNTGRTASKETPANANNDGTGANIVSGYTELPCAVLADAINVLSNSWNDANSSQGVGSRAASPTTINAAIVSGIVPSGQGTGANSYSGGAENFPRFLEDWSGKTFTYYGSMVELYKSQQSIGYWGNGNVYNPPKRNWYFDTLFYTQPPPGTLLLITYNKQRWFVQ